MAVDPAPSDAARALAAFGLQHAIASIRRGGPLIPIVLSETESSRDLDRYLSDRLEDSVEAARVGASTSAADRVVLLYDGYLTRDGVRTDAIFAESHERGDDVSQVFARRYGTGGLLRRVRPTGELVELGTAAPLR